MSKGRAAIRVPRLSHKPFLIQDALFRCHHPASHRARQLPLRAVYEQCVEVVHIIPESEGGLDTIENAVTLCASCRSEGKSIAAASRRRRLQEARDGWWKRCAPLRPSTHLAWLYRGREQEATAFHLGVLSDSEKSNSCTRSILSPRFLGDLLSERTGCTGKQRMEIRWPTPRSRTDSRVH